MKPRPLFANLSGLLAALGCVLSLCVQSARAADDAISGLVGVGTWATQAEFKDIKVVKAGRTLFESDFSKGLQGWAIGPGRWEVVDGALRQTGSEQGSRALIANTAWSDCTLTLKARKLGGAEGFLILFGVPSPAASAPSWWNLGGWNNTANALQFPGIAEHKKRGSIETGRWYDIRLELAGDTVRAYLDNELVQTGVRPSDRNAQREFPHALIPDLLADPSIIEVDGVFYCYATTDGMGQGLKTSGPPVVWKSRDFENWSFEGTIYPPGFDAKYWAPSAPVKKDGRWYLFPTLDGRVTATVSDSLEGPFRALDGKDIRQGSGWKPFPSGLPHPIDAELIQNDDGAYYMVLSRRQMAKMNAGFSGFDGAPFEIKTKRGGYSEGPAIFKRDGIYYYLYTLGGGESYQYAYMMSRHSALGQWEAPEQDIVATTDREQGIFGPGHGCFFHLEGSDRWVFVHLEFGRGSTNRQIVATEMRFNADGTLQPIKLSLKGLGSLRIDANYARSNLALGAAATASSAEPDFRVKGDTPAINRIESFSPANALDGSNGSRWMAAANDSPAWFQVDLGQIRDVTRAEAYFVKPTLGHAYRLDSSLDGKTWKPCGGHDDVQVRSPHTDPKIGRARYLKLTVLQGTPGLWEFRVY